MERAWIIKQGQVRLIKTYLFLASVSGYRITSPRELCYCTSTKHAVDAMENIDPRTVFVGDT